MILTPNRLASSLLTATFALLVSMSALAIAGPTDGEVLLRAYPNPATSVVNVKIAEYDDERLTLTLETIDGTVILKDKVNAPGIHKVNTRLLAPGSYVVRIQSADGTLDERAPFNKVNP